MRYAAVIFDLDGTLVDTLRDIADSVNHVLRRLSLPTHPLKAFRLLVGDGSRTMVSRALPPDRQDLLDDALRLQIGHYAAHLCDHSRPYPGIPETLSALRARGLRAAVFSNKPDSLTQALITRLFEPGAFAVVLGQRPDRPLKPDPAGALEIAAELRLPPVQIAYVGDSGVDMQTARAAGMTPLGAAWGFRTHDELLQHGASAVLDDPARLFDLLTP